ncbi:MAG: hypothetical protein AAF694_25915 [Bacteroidota bacterium]
MRKVVWITAVFFLFLCSQASSHFVESYNSLPFVESEPSEWQIRSLEKEGVEQVKKGETYQINFEPDGGLLLLCKDGTSGGYWNWEDSRLTLNLSGEAILSNILNAQWTLKSHSKKEYKFYSPTSGNFLHLKRVRP